MLVNLEDSIRQLISSYMSHVHTAIPATIISYESATQKAQVKPLIKNTYYNKKSIELPAIVDVPVLFPHGKNCGLKFPISKGDSVLLIFSEAPLERWLSASATDVLVEKGVDGRFELTDAIAIPCVFPLADFYDDEADAVILKFNNAKLILRKNGEIALQNKIGNINITSETGDVVISNNSNNSKITMSNSGDIAINSDSNINVQSNNNAKLRLADNTLDLTNTTHSLLQQISAIALLIYQAEVNGSKLNNYGQFLTIYNIIQEMKNG